MMGQQPASFRYRAFHVTPCVHVMFFHDGSEPGPPDSVGRELRTAASNTGAPTRGIAADVLTDITSGLIGNAAYAAAAAGLVATSTFLRRTRARPAATLTTAADAVASLRNAGASIRGTDSLVMKDVDVTQRADGGWSATFTLGGVGVSAEIDATGEVVVWRDAEPHG